MEEKLDNLALSRRRLASPYLSRETEDEDVMFKKLSFYETEDRKTGTFPYDDSLVQTIRDFYAGKNILITGGTGFVGKVLIEKLLRSLPEGGRMYLLLRGRKGLSPQERVQAMLKLPLFKLVMTENPKAAERLVAVEGDCASLGLGLSNHDRQSIIDNVSIVFHCAATVRFNLPFSHVILVNTRGTREMVHLSKDLKKLDAFVYVSTGFSCATSNRATPIPEEIVPAGMDWRTVIAGAEKSSRGLKRDGFDLIFEKLETKHPNNYTFSKLLAENLVEEECSNLPAIIVRPTVLIATYEDPFGGWVDNLYGPISLWDGIGRGILRTHYGYPEAEVDHLPVDFSIKTMITAAWHRGLGFRMRPNPENIDVINSCTSSYAKQSFATQMPHAKFCFDQATHKYIFRYPRCYMTNNYWVFWFINIASQLPLGILLDALLILKGRKPMLLETYRRIFFTQAYFLNYFVTHEFHYEDKWQWTLDARIPREDRLRFSWITKCFQMAYKIDNVAGIIKYVFNETPVKSEQSNRKIMHIVDWIHTAILAAFGLWILWIGFIRKY